MATKMDNQQPNLFVGKKVCRVCSAEKEVSEFKLHNNRGTTYRKNTCIECERAWHRDHYRKTITPARRRANARTAKRYREKDRNAYNARNRRFKMLHRERDRQLIYKAYGNKCTCCGETDHGFFTIDHVNNDGHIERKNGLYTSGSQFYRQIIQQNFPKNYQILCYNCNLGRARNGGICPHQKGSETTRQRGRAKRPEVPTAPKGR
jgi:hypothetical protein